MEQPVEQRRVEPPRVDVPADLGERDLVVFAREVNDGYGDYDGSVVTVVKELREAGADAAYEHDADARRWIGENAAEALVLDLIVGIAANAGWAALAAVLLRRRSERVRVKWTVASKTDEDTQWFEAEGSGEDVAAVVEALQPPEPEGARSEDEPEA